MSSTCAICRSAECDEVRFGSIYRVSPRVSAHEKCLVLTVYKDGGIFALSNITEKDVLAAKNRTESMICDYCDKRGANLFCAHYNCETRYHTGCGIDHKALVTFLGEIYLSYCPNHIPGPNPANSPGTNESCSICLEDIRRDGEEFNPVTMVQSPCCLNGWYHWKCMQTYALSSAVMFKCPLCNNARRFRDITYWGIYVPIRLPSWELEPGAYSGLFERIQICAAPQCPQPNGPSANLGDLIECNRCGSNPMHLTCIPRSAMAYTCTSCNLRSLRGYQPPPLEAEEEAVNLQLSFVSSWDSLTNSLNISVRSRSHDSLSQDTNDENTAPNNQLRSNAAGSRLQSSPKQSSPARRGRSRSINRRRQTHIDPSPSTGSDDIIDLTLTDEESDMPVYNLRSTRITRNPLVNQQLNNIGANSGEQSEDTDSHTNTINSPVSSRTRSMTRRGNQEHLLK